MYQKKERDDDLQLLLRLLKSVNIGAYLDCSDGTFESPTESSRSESERLITEYLNEKNIIEKDGQLLFVHRRDAHDNDGFKAQLVLSRPLSEEQRSAAQALLGQSRPVEVKLTAEQKTKIYNEFDKNFQLFEQTLREQLKINPPTPKSHSRYTQADLVQLAHNLPESLYEGLRSYMGHALKSFENNGQGKKEPFPDGVNKLFEKVGWLWDNNNFSAQLVKDAKATVNDAIGKVLNIGNQPDVTP